MEWEPIAISVFVAVIVTIILVALFGWRRPNASEAESSALSALFAFMLFFAVVWASAVYLTGPGPLIWGVPWLALLIVGCIAALLVLLSTPTREIPRASYAGPGPSSSSSADASAAVIDGFGALFWIVVCVLLIAAAFGALG